MKTGKRLAILLLIVMLMTAAYFTGSLVAVGQQGAGSTASPDLTAAQWAAIQGANMLLLGQPDSELFLPLIDG